jgi:L-glutamine-phosphate cytidylyltransferase
LGVTDLDLPGILLAAGRGARLRPLTDDRPKAMVEVGGEALAARALRTLRSAGIERVVAVTGFAAETLSGLECELRHNARWDTDENVVSLWCARDLVAGGCYVVNSDVVFGDAVCEALTSRSGTFLLCDGGHPLDAEAMKAEVAGGRLVRLSKAAAPERSAGEYIGLLRVDPADGPRLGEILGDYVDRGETQVYYEDAIEALARERTVEVVSVDGLPWAEIDDHADLERAQKEVLARV